MAVLGATLPAASQPAAPTLDKELFEPLKWREIGPFRGGRSAAVAGIESQLDTYYFGATGGGVWKTTDYGSSWKNVSDGFFGGSIGAVAVAPGDPNVLYVGGGEKTVRGNVSHGYGIWKSTDAGKTWTQKGLEDSHHVPRIRVHPQDPETVYAAVLGHLYEDHPTRGVYRSTDGGDTWKQLLFVNDAAGAVELEMDPNNPRILYAAFWRVRRTPWSLESGGEGSGLWKSTDGGETWKELSEKKGFPKGTLGIIGVAVSPTNSENVYAIVEAEEGGVFRSKDGGETWKRTSKDRNLRQRAWYYTRIYADPQSEEGVYVPNVRFHRSRDGGKTFETIDTPHGDHHDLWISRANPERMIHGSDGGASVSLSGGKSWSPQNNQPTAQIYRVTTDDRSPYRIYGAQQDNSSLRVRHRSDGSSIGFRDWEPTAGGESGYIVPDPQDPDIVYGGSYGGFLTRRNHRTGETRIINVWPDNPMGWAAGDLRYRFQWNFPIFFSPHDPEALFAAGNQLFTTTDEGQSWKAVSPDLTRNEPQTLGSSGGPITKDNTSVEYYATIFSAFESPLRAGVFWAGSDDGLVHISRDFGATWQEVTPPGLPKWAQINGLEPHPEKGSGAYLAATAYKTGDFTPYLFVTEDAGATWRRIDSGIDRQHFTRAIRVDPDRPGLLYAGTESGVYVSFNDGRKWQPLQLNLPIVPITDLAVRNGDLIAATQGRGFWALDDLGLLHQLQAAQLQEAVHLFTPEPVIRTASGGGDRRANTGENPATGAVLYYFLNNPPEDAEVRIEILDEAGTLIRSYPKKGDQDEKKADEADSDEDGAKTTPTARKGLNRFEWDLRYEAPKEVPKMILWGGQARGPKALPGNYLVRLAVDGASTTAQFRVLQDPRSEVAHEALEEQFAFLSAVRDTLDRTHQAILDIRQAREQVRELEARLEELPEDRAEGGEEVKAAGKKLDEDLTAIEEALYQTKNQSRQDPLNFPIRLNNKLSALANTVDGSLDRPTDQAEAVRVEITAAIEEELKKLEEIWSQDLPAFNALVREQDIPALAVEATTPSGETP